MRKFVNTAEKVKAVLSVFGRGEKLRMREITERLKGKGYALKEAHLRMFIYYNMLYKYLLKEEVRGTSYYTLA